MKNVLIFLAGAAAGAVSVAIYVKKKLVPAIREELEIKMQMEAQAVPDYSEYYGADGDEKSEEDEEGEEEIKPVSSSPKHNSPIKPAKVKITDYTGYAVESVVDDLEDKVNDISKKVEEMTTAVSAQQEKPEETETRGSGPYVIDPGSYDMYSDFEAHEYVIYADGVVIDDETEERLDKDPELVFGKTAMDILESGRDSIVFVRDEALKRDYSITRSDVPFDGPDYPDPEDDWRS